jgi:hypothetical protein
MKKVTEADMLAALNRPQPRIVPVEHEIICDVTDVSGPKVWTYRWQVEKPTIYKTFYSNVRGDRIAVTSFKIGMCEQFVGALPLGAVYADELTPPSECPSLHFATLTPDIAATITLAYGAGNPLGDLPRLPHGLYCQKVNGRARTVRESDEHGKIRIILEGEAVE